MDSSNFTAKYASAQFDCAACGKSVRPNALILGLVKLNSFGFEPKKLHHWFCIPKIYLPIDSVEGLDGFDTLKDSDKVLIEDFLTSGKHKGGDEKSSKESKVLEADEVAGDELEGSNPKKLKVGKADEVIANELEGSNPKKLKVGKADEVTANELEGSNSKKPKVGKADEVTANELEGSNSKKPKVGKANEVTANELEGSDSEKPKIVAQKAKSNRSTCKQCLESIPAKDLRLGLKSKNSRGFIMTNWHHVDCFPIVSEPILSVENIDGFSSLEISDQEKLKILIAERNHLPKNEIEGSDKKSSKVSKANEVALDECEGNNSMKPKIVIVYAMSNRSTCKQCAQPILAKNLMLGLESKNSEGLDATDWHHLECFLLDTEPIDSVKSITGFSALKISDQKEVKNLIEGCNHLPKENEIEGSDKKSSKVSKANKVAVDECEGNNSKKPKVRTKVRMWTRSEGCDEESSKVSKVRKQMQLLRLDSMVVSQSQTSASFKKAKPEFVYSVSDVNNSYYKDALLRPNWKAFRSIIFLEQEQRLHGSAKIAAFGFEGCLLDTLRSASAGSLLDMSIPVKLKSLCADGYKLVIFINESEIESWKNKRQTAVNCILKRVDDFISHVNVPIQVFVACGIDKTEGQTEDPFSKPKTGMWTIMEQQFNSDIKIDIDQSFYVGNLARGINDEDKGFAEAIGLKFFLPEDYFDT